jgi:hypothetical protein
VIEAGALLVQTERQILFIPQLPLAKSTILAGINQVILFINGYRFNVLELKDLKYSVSRNSTERH